MPIALPAYYRHDIYQGTDYSVDLVLSDANGYAIDLTGATVSSAIADLEGEQVGVFAVSITAPTTGGLRVEYSSDAPIIPAGRYLHELFVRTPADGARVYLAGDVISYGRVVKNASLVPPTGFTFLTGVDGYYLTGSDNFYLLGVEEGEEMTPPEGFAFLTGPDGYYLTGSDNFYLLGVAP